MDKPPKLTLGWEVIGWIEKYLVHGPGDVQGEPIFLDDEFTRFILKCYELRPDGRRKVRRAFISRAKGRAKSELAGMLACVEALGPVRFDGWNAKKKPVGRPVTAPEILAVATEEGQADNTYSNVVYMLQNLRDTHGSEFSGLDPGLTRCFFGRGGGEITPISAKARSKDGGRSTFCIFDELHLFETAELRALHATIRRNLGKRKIAEPWSLETSTMYRPGTDSVAEATHEYWRSIADGRRKDDGLVFDHRQGPVDFEWEDDEALKLALQEAYGEAAGWVDIERIVAEIRDPQSEEADSRRYWLNQVVRSTEQAFDPVQWAELAAPQQIDDGELITLGFDGARFHDSTALVATHLETGYQWVMGIWERPQFVPDWEVDEGEVTAAVDEAFSRYKIWRFYADPPYWETTVDSWIGRFGDKRVIKWWTHRTRPMAFALRSYANAQKSADLSHDGNTVFARHIANARRRESRARDEDGRPLWTVSKEHSNSPNKIDAAMAGCLSWEARGDAIAAGMLRRQSSVYETRGVELLP